VAHRQRRDSPSALEDFFFLPQQPYLQHGTLRSQLIYPSAQSDLSDEQLLAILEQVHLPHLAERVGGLDAVQDWEKLLSVGEQQRLAFGRVLVHQPGIVILDEATSALDSSNEASLYARLRDSGTTLISIAHRAAVLRHHTHVLQLMGDGRVGRCTTFARVVVVRMTAKLSAVCS
jgi:putative ATP-binding cassette transporter